MNFKLAVNDNKDVINPQSTPYSSTKANGGLLDNVFALRYGAYIEDGSIKENDTHRFFDEYDHLENCQSFLTYSGDNIIGSIRACKYIPGKYEDIPVLDIFKDEIEGVLGLDKPFIESNKFVIAPDYQRKGGLRARFHLVNNILDYAVESGIDTVVTAVRPEHVRNYKMFHFRPISGVKSYPHLSFSTVLLALDNITNLRKFILSKI